MIIDPSLCISIATNTYTTLNYLYGLYGKYKESRQHIELLKSQVEVTEQTLLQLQEALQDQQEFIVVSTQRTIFRGVQVCESVLKNVQDFANKMNAESKRSRLQDVWDRDTSNRWKTDLALQRQSLCELVQLVMA
jgi:hypothetical protein